MVCYSKQKETINAKSKKTKIYQEKQTLVDLNELINLNNITVRSPFFI